MLVRNNFMRDSRVLNEANTLIDTGFLVSVIALHTKETLVSENLNGINVVRVKIGFDKNFFKRKIKNLNKANNNWHRNKILTLFTIRKSLVSRLRTFFQKNRLKGFKLAKALVVLSFKNISGVLKINRNIFNRSSSLLTFMQAPIMNSLSRRFRHLATSIRMYKAAKNVNADIYHCHDLNTMLSGYLAAKKQKAFLIYDSHELYTERNTLTYSRWQKIKDRNLEKFTIKRVNASITVNEYISELLEERYKIKKPLVLMNCPKSSNGSSSYLPNNKNKRIVIYVGAITFNRGIECLIDSAQYLDDNINIVLMGDGSQKFIQGIYERISDFGKNKIIHLQPVASDNVVNVIKSASLGIAPTQASCLSYLYSSPNKIFQYIQAGLPIIGSDIPFHRDVILGHKIGYIYESNSPKELANAINKILADREFNSIKQRVADIQQKYCWEKESKKLLRLYDSLPG